MVVSANPHSYPYFYHQLTTIHLYKYRLIILFITLNLFISPSIAFSDNFNSGTAEGWNLVGSWNTNKINPLDSTYYLSTKPDSATINYASHSISSSDNYWEFDIGADAQSGTMYNCVSVMVKSQVSSVARSADSGGCLNDGSNFVGLSFYTYVPVSTPQIAKIYGNGFTGFTDRTALTYTWLHVVVNESSPNNYNIKFYDSDNNLVDEQTVTGDTITSNTFKVGVAQSTFGTAESGIDNVFSGDYHYLEGNTWIHFNPDTSNTNSTNITLDYSINGNDFSSGSPDNIGLIVSYCKWSNYLNQTTGNGWSCFAELPNNYMYFEEFGTWQQTFLNPFNTNLSDFIVSNDYTNTKLSIYARLVKGLNCNPYCNHQAIVASDTIIYDANYTIPNVPNPTAIPTLPQPTNPIPSQTVPPMPTPISTTIPNATNNSINNSWIGGYYEYINNSMSGFNNTLMNISNYMAYPTNNLSDKIDYINDSLNGLNLSTHNNFIVLVIPAVVASFPAKLKALVTYFLILLIILIILGR